MGDGGVGSTGMDCNWLSCIHSIVGDAGLDGCPNAFNRTIVLIRATASSVRKIVFFMSVSMWLHLTAINLARHPALELKLRAGPAVGYGV